MTQTASPAPTARRRVATIDALLKKRRREDLVVVPMKDDAGEAIELTIRYRALSAKEYDDLQAKFPPTAAQKKDGAIFDVDGFAPALISACAIDPPISVEDATAIYSADEWSGGEVAELFFRAQRLCNAGLDASFTAAD